MIRVKFRFKDKDCDDLDWPDEATVSSLETAEDEIIKLLEEFNAEEKRRYGKRARLREFVRLEDEEMHEKTHEWEKVEAFSGVYQSYICRNCKLVIKRHFTNVPSRYSGVCHPDRVCVHCNKEFKSAKNLERHMVRVHGEDDE